MPERGLLFSQMQPPLELEREFHDWYEAEHIPVRMAIPGFAGATRYEAVEGDPKFLACYFLDDLACLKSDRYLQLKADPGERTAKMLASVDGFTRYLCKQTFDTGPSAEPVGRMFVTTFSTPDVEAAARLDDWYENEHMPMLIQADGWLRIRRFEPFGSFDGPNWTHIALHELRNESILDAPERAAARSTPWRDRLAEESWFSASGRWLYRPIHSATATHPPTQEVSS